MMTKRLLAILALVAYLSTGCFTVLGAMSDATTPPTKHGKPTTSSNSGLLGGMVIDAMLFGLAALAVHNIDLSWGCDDCSD